MKKLICFELKGSYCVECIQNGTLHIDEWLCLINRTYVHKIESYSIGSNKIIIDEIANAKSN